MPLSQSQIVSLILSFFLIFVALLHMFHSSIDPHEGNDTAAFTPVPPPHSNFAGIF